VFVKKDPNGASKEKSLVGSFIDEINSIGVKMKFKYDEFQYEAHFGKTNPVNEIKSYVELMKDLNLDLR
jgi:hypothetical protein